MQTLLIFVITIAVVFFATVIDTFLLVSRRMKTRLVLVPLVVLFFTNMRIDVPAFSRIVFEDVSTRSILIAYVVVAIGMLASWFCGRRFARWLIA